MARTRGLHPTPAVLQCVLGLHEGCDVILNTPQLQHPVEFRAGGCAVATRLYIAARGESRRERYRPEEHDQSFSPQSATSEGNSKPCGQPQFLLSLSLLPMLSVTFTPSLHEHTNCSFRPMIMSMLITQRNCDAEATLAKASIVDQVSSLDSQGPSMASLPGCVRLLLRSSRCLHASPPGACGLTVSDGRDHISGLSWQSF